MIERATVTRREALVLGAQVLAGVALGCRLPGRPIASPPLPRFLHTFQVTPLLRAVRSVDTTDYDEFTQRVGALGILPATLTEIWGFDGLAPGPTIHARRGRRVVVQLTNLLGVPTVVHLHPTGGDVLNPDMRGGPTLGFILFATKAGFIRLYCQVSIGGRMLFAPINLNVEP